MAAYTSVSSCFLSTGATSRRAVPCRPGRAVVARSRVVAVAEMTADGGMQKKPKGEKRKKMVTGIMKPRPISPELQDLVGAPEMARTDVIKAVWGYIKENNLQDPEDKRVIVCDEKLKKIFGGNDRVNFLEVSRLISPHILK